MDKNTDNLTVLPKTDELLTPAEYKIIWEQIRKNAEVIERYIDRIDLLVNKERYPRNAPEVERIRERLNILIEENDTFRRVFWRHVQLAEKWLDFQFSLPDPVQFLVQCIKRREQARVHDHL
ncbi:MAG: hypothetical protein PHE61_07880 [Candidatus Omnitrophica bacterium]|nr:hypothetical protein [Candidatus Omnitrophota bacterium]